MIGIQNNPNNYNAQIKHMDDSNLKVKLSQSISIISWNEIKPDILKDVLFLVDRGLDLLEVAKACAKDDKPSFTLWLEKNLISKPTSDQITHWGTNNTKLQCCLVKPFVFIQEVQLN